MDKPKRSKPAGADRRWTLLFIGDHGNVITLKYFKAIVIGAGLLFFFAIVSVAVLLYQNVGNLKQNRVLQKRFADSENQVEKLRHEKEILMARLVLAEAKTKENVDGAGQIQERMKVAETVAPQPQVAPKPEAVKAEQKKPPVSREIPAQPQPEPAETDEAEPTVSVAVANFKVSRESENQNLTAEFKIRNTSPEPQRVEGYAVVVLKGDELQKDQWLVIPAVGLVGERPSGKRGRSFSIQRFRTMSFSSKAPEYSDQFETAAVYVFAKTGELLLEQEFSVELPPAPVKPPEKPASPTVSDQTPAGSSPVNETPAAETPAGPSTADEAAADEMPSIDFSIDSMKKAPPVF